MSDRTSNLRVIEPFRSKDGVRAEVFKSTLGGPGCVIIQADTPAGDDAEVTLNVREAHDLMLWLQCALGIATPETTVPLTFAHGTDEHHVLRILGNDQITASKAAELIRSIQNGNTPELVPFEPYCEFQPHARRFDDPLIASLRNAATHAEETFGSASIARAIREAIAALTTSPEKASVRSTEGTCTCRPEHDPAGCMAETCPRVIAYRAAQKTGGEP